MTERNFFLERLMERAFELQAKHRSNPETYHVDRRTREEEDKAKP